MTSAIQPEKEEGETDSLRRHRAPGETNEWDTCIQDSHGYA
jgi:hypothetical protein